MSGKIVYLKISGFELPIRYSPNGSMAGSMGVVAASLARGDSASDRGKWWIAGNQLCQRWTSWMGGKSYCYTLTRQGKSVRWLRNDVPAPRGSAEGLVSDWCVTPAGFIASSRISGSFRACWSRLGQELAASISP